MESTDSSTTSSQQPNLPPGFRFHPTDEELVIHYLKKKTSSAPLPVAIIAEVDLYKFDPWELPAKATFGEQEWYFFSPRDRKYPNGARPNRAATSGYWKATGTDKPILTSGGTQKVGVKKALVFYGGKPPKGIKTNWIMHEYRLTDNKPNNKPPGYDLGNKKNSLRLDDWVLCRIYKKNNMHRPLDHDKDDSMDDILGSSVPVLPSSISSSIGRQHNGKFEFPTTTTTTKGTSSFGTLLEIQEHNLFEGMFEGKSDHLSSVVNHPLIKRTLPSPLYWNSTTDEAEAAGAGPSITKTTFHGGDRHSNDDDDDESMVDKTTTDGNGTSIATLLSQLPPQTPNSLQQQTMLGSIGSDGVFRPPYPLSGFNWFT